MTAYREGISRLPVSISTAHNSEHTTRTTMNRQTSHSSSSTSPDSSPTKLSTLGLHPLPDDKPVFACYKCSEVVVSETISSSKSRLLSPVEGPGLV